MACFLAPAGVAIVTTVIQKVVKKREGAAALAEGQSASTKGKWTQRLGLVEHHALGRCRPPLP